MRIAGTILLLLLGSGCAPAPEGPPNVLFVVIDTLRADRLGAYGHARDTSPHIDALAASGVRFDRAYSTASWTKPAIASMITGLYPSSHGARSLGTRLSDAAETLPEILRAHGDTTAGVVSHVLLQPEGGLAQGYDVWKYGRGMGPDSISTPGVTAKAEASLEDLAVGDARFFLFVRYFDPHFKYRDQPELPWAKSGKVERIDPELRTRQFQRLRRDITAQELDQVLGLYDEEIRRTDAGLGRVLEKLGYVDPE